MAEQHLDGTNVSAGFQQMSGEAVAQRVHRHRLAERGRSTRSAAGGLQHARVKVPALVLTRKEPVTGPCCLPVAAKHREELGGEHDVAILATFSLIDADQHPAAIDVDD